MRIRLLAAGAVVAGLTLVGPAHSAFAVEPASTSAESCVSKEVEECVHLAELNNDPAACQ